MEPKFNVEDLKRFAERYNTEKETGHVSKQAQFTYAWSLIQSPDNADIEKGVFLLQDLCTHGTDQRDYLYYLAEGNYNLSEYPIALKYINRVLDIEPSNKQAQELKEKIEYKMKKDGILGAVIAGAGMVAVGGAAVLIGLFAKRK